MHLHIEAEATAALLCRLVGFAAQLDLPAPPMRVALEHSTMIVELELRGIERHLGMIVAEKMARAVGVTSVRVDGRSLDSSCSALAA